MPLPVALAPLPLQLASFAIVVNQLKNIYDAFFVSECERCRGTGIVTCPHVSRRRQEGGRSGQGAAAWLRVVQRGCCLAAGAPRLCCIEGQALTAPPCPRPRPSQCHGSKTLRRRPGYLRTRDFGIVDDSRDSYLCFYCGPPTAVSASLGSVGLRQAACVSGGVGCLPLRRLRRPPSP